MIDDRMDRPEVVDAAPGVCTGQEGRPGHELQTLDVEGEQLAICRSHDGGTHYDWVSGRNRDYGLSSSANPDQSDELHRQSIRGFLHMIDPETGYIAED